MIKKCSSNLRNLRNLLFRGSKPLPAGKWRKLVKVRRFAKPLAGVPPHPVTHPPPFTPRRQRRNRVSSQTPATLVQVNQGSTNPPLDCPGRILPLAEDPSGLVTKPQGPADRVASSAVGNPSSLGKGFHRGGIRCRCGSDISDLRDPQEGSGEMEVDSRPPLPQLIPATRTLQDVGGSPYLPDRSSGLVDGHDGPPIRIPSGPYGTQHTQTPRIPRGRENVSVQRFTLRVQPGTIGVPEAHERVPQTDPQPRHSMPRLPGRFYRRSGDQGAAPSPDAYSRRHHGATRPHERDHKGPLGTTSNGRVVRNRDRPPQVEVLYHTRKEGESYVPSRQTDPRRQGTSGANHETIRQLGGVYQLPVAGMSAAPAVYPRPVRGPSTEQIVEREVHPSDINTAGPPQDGRSIKHGHGGTHIHEPRVYHGVRHAPSDRRIPHSVGRHNSARGQETRGERRLVVGRPPPVYFPPGSHSHQECNTHLGLSAEGRLPDCQIGQHGHCDSPVQDEGEKQSLPRDYQRNLGIGMEAGSFLNDTAHPRSRQYRSGRPVTYHRQRYIQRIPGPVPVGSNELDNLYDRQVRQPPEQPSAQVQFPLGLPRIGSDRCPRPVKLGGRNQLVQPPLGVAPQIGQPPRGDQGPVGNCSSLVAISNLVAYVERALSQEHVHTEGASTIPLPRSGTNDKGPTVQMERGPFLGQPPCPAAWTIKPRHQQKAVNPRYDRRIPEMTLLDRPDLAVVLQETLMQLPLVNTRLSTARTYLSPLKRWSPNFCMSLN